MPKFHVARSIDILAPSEEVYQTLVDYKTWTTWSPWLIAEPNAKVTISNDATSVGSTYEWAGKVTGEGKLQHRRLEANRLIEDDLNFLKPFKSYADVAFQLQSINAGTKVTWLMNSSLPWFMFWMVPMMKTFIGMDYSRGLAMLKEHIETGNISSQSSIKGVSQAQSFRMAGIAGSCSTDQIGPAMNRAFGEAQSEFKRHGIPMDGEMISVYTKFRVKDGVFEYISGYIIPETANIPSNSRLKTWGTSASKIFCVQHTGSYKHLGNAWSIANMHARQLKLKQCKGGTYEIYRTIPPVPESELVTDICLPLK